MLIQKEAASALLPVFDFPVTHKPQLTLLSNKPVHRIKSEGHAHRVVLQISQELTSEAYSCYQQKLMSLISFGPNKFDKKPLITTRGKGDMHHGMFKLESKDGI
jgi:hypothetical protein